MSLPDEPPSATLHAACSSRLTPSTAVWVRASFSPQGLLRVLASGSPANTELIVAAGGTAAVRALQDRARHCHCLPLHAASCCRCLHCEGTACRRVVPLPLCLRH